LSDQEEKDNLPTLVEPPSGFDATAASGIGALFSSETFSVAMSKVSALEALFSAVTQDSNFNHFIHEVLMVFINVVKSEAGSVFEVDHSNSTLFFRAVVGSSSDRLADVVIPWGQGIVGHVAESKLPLVVDNVPENSVHLKSIEKAVGFETRNLVAVPILVRGKVYGVVELLNRIGESNYSNSDVDLLQYLCKMAAQAIEVRLMVMWGKK
jgi:GAF domain-containing protein